MWAMAQTTVLGNGSVLPKEGATLLSMAFITGVIDV